MDTRNSTTGHDPTGENDVPVTSGRGLGRRRLLQLAGAGTTALAATAVATPAASADDGHRGSGGRWDKTFPKSPKVRHEKVSFKNRLGIELVADLYIPKRLRGKAPALVVGHPFGGVKEQTSGLYAQAMAERGFVTVAWDASYNGESGGRRLPHFIASPEAFTEDFSAAVDYIGLHPTVDRDRIGALGVCGSGSFALAAAQIDPRIKAVATASMYDMGRAIRQHLDDSRSEADRREELVRLGEQRWAEAAGGETAYNLGTPETIEDDSPAVAKEFFDYYRTPRGQHPRSTTAVSWNSSGAMMQFFPFQNLEWIGPRPVLFLHGETAHSRYFSEDAYRKASEPKELYIVPGAGHVDLYDRVDLIPWDKLSSFFTANL